MKLKALFALFVLICLIQDATGGPLLLTALFVKKGLFKIVKIRKMKRAKVYVLRRILKAPEIFMPVPLFWRGHSFEFGPYIGCW